MDDVKRVRRRIARLKAELDAAYEERRRLVVAAADDLVPERELARLWGVKQPMINMIIHPDRARERRRAARRKPEQ